MTRTIRPEQIDFSDQASTAVWSDSLRFVLPVPQLADDGERFESPDGERLTDGHGQPLTGRGELFLDPNDRSWEAVRGDGTGVIVISPVTIEQGARLSAKAR